MNGKTEIVNGDKRLGIFGGTFDPPHVGHQILASEAADQLSLDKVLWVLTPNPPHKRDHSITPLEYRLMMAEAAINADPTFELSRIEIDRSPPHYAVDTVNLLHRHYPEAALVYLIGSDSLRHLTYWHDAQGFVDTCDALGVMCRPGEKADLWALEDHIQGIVDKVEFIDAPLLEISSTEIRERIAAGGTFRYYLPQEVYKVILSLNLYKE